MKATDTEVRDRERTGGLGTGVVVGVLTKPPRIPLLQRSKEGMKGGATTKTSLDTINTCFELERDG